MLVDYINADGTLNSDAYEFLGRLSAQCTDYEPFLGGELVADVAIYYDKESMYNPAEKGAHVTKLQASDHCPHRDAVVGAARILQEAHIPFGPVGATARVWIPEGRRAVRVLRLPECEAMPFESVGPYVQFQIKPFDALAMSAVEHEER